jgi:hypothetical protein
MKRILQLFIATVAVTLLMSKCKKDDDVIGSTISTHIDLKGSASLAPHNNAAMMVFSTNGGTSYNSGLTISNGQAFKAKVMDVTAGSTLSADGTFLTFDWSASNPQPSNTSADAADFTFSGGMKISVVVVDQHCDFNSSSWVGTWGGTEVGPGVGGTDTNHITVDGSNPNKFTMDNYFGDGVDAFFILNTSTSALDQTITMPSQPTSEGGVAAGTGTYDQCRGTFTINTTYKLGTTTYAWAYNFVKK